MVDRADVIRQMTELLLAKHKQQNPGGGGEGGPGVDEDAVIAAIGEALAEILAGFEGDLSEVSPEELAAVVDEFVGQAIDEVA